MFSWWLNWPPFKPAALLVWNFSFFSIRPAVFLAGGRAVTWHQILAPINYQLACRPAGVTFSEYSFGKSLVTELFPYSPSSGLTQWNFMIGMGRGILYIGWAVQGSTFRVEKTKAPRIKGIVSSAGYKSVSLNGVWRIFQILINTGSSIHLS